MKWIFGLLLFPTILNAQLTQKDSLWLPFQPLIGHWTGEGSGESGNGIYERSYQFVLGNNFIEVRNKSTYPPKDAQSIGEIHEDVGYISYDKARKTFILRQFHKEGFVNEYVLDSMSPDGTTIVFITESIENIPAGWKARETYWFRAPDTLEEVFDLAAPGGEFEMYSTASLLKTKM